MNVTPKTLRRLSELDAAGLTPANQRDALEKVAARYAVAITPAMAALIDRADPHDPIARQFVPDAAELDDDAATSAPIRSATTRTAPVAGIVHRYPDRVLLKLTARLRRSIAASASAARWSGRDGRARCRREQLDAALAYIARAPGDLGGDPHRRRSAGAVAAPPRARSMRAARRHRRTSRWCACTPACRSSTPERVTPRARRAR